MIHRSSNYDPLGEYLKAVTDSQVELSLGAIADLVGPLPAEAARPQFWANARNYHDARRRQWLDNGFNAYLDRGREIVRFVRVGAEQSDSRPDTPWTEHELRACVTAYHQIWSAEQQNIRINKSEVRRGVLSRELQGRSEGSYEFRMQNISALLDELGMPFIRGYLPRRNVGNQKASLVAIINELWNRVDVRESPTSDSASLDTRTLAALAKPRAKSENPPPGSQNVQIAEGLTSRFVRDPEVVAWVLLRAAGVCEACGERSPFDRADGSPYLEAHHLRALAEGGPDVVDNTIAVCPNCHRRLHFAGDRTAYRRAVLLRHPTLKNYPKRAIVSHPADSIIKGQ